MKYSISDLAYGGRYHNQFWNPQFNKEANIQNALANCTTAVIGFCLVEKNPLPVSTIANASNWHNLLINGWRCIDFDKSKVKVGDIIQWVDKCHVCKVADIVDGTIYINGSFYTGEHGVAYYQGGFDTRKRFNSLQELSDFMVENYPTRFYHYWTLDKESQMVGGQPEHILVCPETFAPVERNTSVNQIQTTDDTLRIRTKPSLEADIVGHVQVGYYDVIATKKADGYTWYQLVTDKWCADISTIYLPADDDALKELERIFKSITAKIDEKDKELQKANEKLRKIKEIIDG